MGIFTKIANSSKLKKKEKTEQKLVPTYLKQDYVNGEDLRELLEVRFDNFKITV
jgi:hypothetical protein